MELHLTLLVLISKIEHNKNSPANHWAIFIAR